MKTLYGICGSTASGKTALAIEVCKRLCGEVVSCDSMQLYRGMDILTAKPSREELSAVRHHLIGEVDPCTKFNASRFVSLADAHISDIIGRGKLPILCGGTGLYIDALTKGIRMSVEADESIRSRLIALSSETGGARKLYEELLRVDPESAAKYAPNDIRRIIRSLEIYYATGKPRSVSEHLDAETPDRYRCLLFALKWDRGVLYERINKRVDIMLENGLIEEVRNILSLDEAFNETASQAIGYKEIRSAFLDEMSMEEAIEQVKIASRHLGKRQETWFKRDPRVIWITANNRSLSDITEEVCSIITKDRNENHE